MTSQTLVERFHETVSKLGDEIALHEDGQPDVTWREFAARAEDLAYGFRQLGLRPGDTAAIVTGNTGLFHVVDMALMLAGGTPFSIASNEPAERITEFLRVADCSLVLVEDTHLALVRAALRGRADVTVVALGTEEAGTEEAGTEEAGTEEAGTEELILAEVAARGAAPGSRDEPLTPVTDPEAVATLIFTSGTTGTPKAVQLSHRAISSSLDAFHLLAAYGEGDDHFVSYLPLSHIAERFMTYYSAVAFGGSIHCVTDPDTLYDEIQRVRPTRFFGVPRVYEKLAERARAQIRSSPELAAALDQSLAAVRAEQRAGRAAAIVVDGAETDHFAPVRAALGFDRTRYLGVATAPSSRELLEFFLAIGLPVGDIWGLSEAIMCTANPVGRIRLGTVGVFLDGVEGVVADDGELLVRGRNVFSGYKGDPARTAELVDRDGWVHTGDLGAIDDGYLRILGRKKEMMITATGKNLMPAVIESAVKGASPLIDHVYSVADGRRFVTALIALDGDAVVRFARDQGLSGTFDELVHSAEVQAEIRDAVARANEQLSHPESVRAWRIVGQEWRPGGDEVTPTMKLRRTEIALKYAETIDELYDA